MFRGVLEMIIQEDFEIHDNLNPVLWKENKLIPEVRNTLLKIAYDFKNYIQIPLDLIDVWVVGSNASYNYNQHSDIDLHLIVNLDVEDCNPVILQTFYNSKKSEYNNDYNFTIKNCKVELYVQDVKSNVMSNGIYSVCKDAWIKEPKPIKHITKHNIEKQVEKWKIVISQVLASNDFDNINNTINNLYLLRANSLAVDGEYGKGNAIFKEIRSRGWLDKLKAKLKETKSKELSLENYTKGQLINRFED